MSVIINWYNNIPIFTKYWLTITITTSVLARFGVLPAHFLFLHSSLVVRHLQIWRVITALFFYPLTPNNGLHFCFYCFFLYNYSCSLENDYFKQSKAEYLYLLLINWLNCSIIGLLSDVWFLMDPMVLSVLYIWCQFNKEVKVRFYFGTTFKAMYLPWVWLGFNLLMSTGGLSALIGIIVGHIYIFFRLIYPQELGGPNLLETPMILKKLFPDTPKHIFGIAPPSRPTQPNLNLL